MPVLASLLAISAILITHNAYCVSALLHMPFSRTIRKSFGIHATGFGGGGGFDVRSNANDNKKMKGSERKKAQQKLLGQYGGDIAKGTEERITKAMSDLPEHIQIAAQLYKKVRQWDAHLSKMSVLAQASIPEQEVDRANRAKNELQRMYAAYGIQEIDMHNLYQRITWDASADAKSARASMGSMSKDIQNRVDKGCEYIAHAVKAAEGASGRCLDVGCGPGILVPVLRKAGVLPSQITGVDLSPEMIRNAQGKHRGVNFIASDFMEEFQDDEGYDAIIFCSSLHDLPDPIGALRKAVLLLRPLGTLVILHAQGASHVDAQVNKNPVMIKRGLPSAGELRDFEGLDIIVEPAPAASKEETQRGYLAVLRKSPEYW